MYKIKKGKTERNVYEVCDKDYLQTQKEDNNIKKFNMLNYFMNELYRKRVNDVKPISTGIPEIDSVFGGGLNPGLYIIGANPGLGKTSLMLHIMVDLALNGNHCLFFNLEMSKFQIMAKLLSNYSYRMNLESKENTKFTINEMSSFKDISLKLKDCRESEFEKFKKVIVNYAKKIDKNINIINASNDDIRNNNISSIETALMNYKIFHKIKPIIIIDFLQLLKVMNDTDDDIKDFSDKRIEMNVIISKLKKLANEYQVTIIAISSLSRKSYTKDEEDDSEIQYDLSVFKETGDIEYTGDFLALLTRGSTVVDFDGSDKNTVVLNVLKSRFSNCVGKKVQLAFIPEYSYFEEKKEEN